MRGRGRRDRAKDKAIWLRDVIILSILIALFTSISSVVFVPMIVGTSGISIPTLFLAIFASIFGVIFATTFVWGAGFWKGRRKGRGGQI